MSATVISLAKVTKQRECTKRAADESELPEKLYSIVVPWAGQ